MTVAELRAGVAVMPEGKRKKLLNESIEEKLLPLFVGCVLQLQMQQQLTKVGLQLQQEI